MPYISPDGRIGGQSGWSLTSIPALFWGFINFIVLFFQTLINPDAANRGSGQSSYSGYSGRKPPPGPPPRRMGRVNHGGGPGAPPMGGG
ncbi:selenoprotein K-like [Eriocheir sinensis]|uniref:selenoprotein K-like n=1 Tax=Eriocheir sinensis TaxID=95602 RepID=UPI0021C626D0|nr:selenoprotein K-like [Eriocheir sinensis]